LNLQAKLNRFSNSLDQYIERFSLRVTPTQFGNRRNVEALFVALDDDIKTTSHTQSYPMASTADILAPGYFLALRRLFLLQLLPLLLQNRFAAQLNFVAFERQNFYQDLIAFIQLVAHLLDAAF